ncbi:hypothetical protein INR49_025234 [Caranx melampygus]|nr:hypothetical protein INR49_025234 [Caranx melampygus]
MAHRLFEGKVQAASYWKYRISPSDHLIQQVLDFLENRECVAEELLFADSSVDLMTAMSAFHWFDRPRFLQEAHRVLKPRGCLALLNYTIDMELSFPDCCSHTLNQICKEALLRDDPQKASSLSQDICQRLMSTMKVTSAETEVVVAVKYFYLLARKPAEA